MIAVPVPVAARSKAEVCGRSPAYIVGSNPTGEWMFVCCECYVLCRKTMRKASQNKQVEPLGDT